jgi:hypothetical protein
VLSSTLAEMGASSCDSVACRSVRHISPPTSFSLYVVMFCARWVCKKTVLAKACIVQIVFHYTSRLCRHSCTCTRQSNTCICTLCMHACMHRLTCAQCVCVCMLAVPGPVCIMLCLCRWLCTCFRYFVYGVCIYSDSSDIVCCRP